MAGLKTGMLFVENGLGRKVARLGNNGEDNVADLGIRCSEGTPQSKLAIVAGSSKLKKPESVIINFNRHLLHQKLESPCPTRQYDHLKARKELLQEFRRSGVNGGRKGGVEPAGYAVL